MVRAAVCCAPREPRHTIAACPWHYYCIDVIPNQQHMVARHMERCRFAKEAHMVKTMPEPTEPVATKKPRVGRRAFLATAATVAVCGAGAIAAPQVVPAVESKMQDMGRTAVLNEIGSLEGVSLDAAIRAAEITGAAVKILVLPLARFVSAVGAGGLGLLLGALDIARRAMSLLRLDTSV